METRDKRLERLTDAEFEELGFYLKRRPIGKHQLMTWSKKIGNVELELLNERVGVKEKGEPVGHYSCRTVFELLNEIDYYERQANAPKETAPMPKPNPKWWKFWKTKTN